MSVAETVRVGHDSAAGVAVALDRISRSFDRTPVIDNLTLDVPAGQFLAVVGRSGSGKSSLLRMISGLDRPNAGRILFDGALTAAGVARIMFQEPRLLPWARVIDNVMVGLRGGLPAAEGRRRALEALRAVGLDGRAEDWPTVLSGGQKQRIALARALVSRPRLLLLDEPLGALDALTRLEMQALVETAWREQAFTAVLVTHDVSEAVRLADRIILLEAGVVTMDLANPAPRPRGPRAAAAVALEETILQRLLRAR